MISRDIVTIIDNLSIVILLRQSKYLTMAAAPDQPPSLDAASKDRLAGTKYDFPRNLTGYGRHPPNPQWPNGAKIAVSFVINYEEVSPEPHLSTMSID